MVACLMLPHLMKWEIKNVERQAFFESNPDAVPHPVTQGAMMSKARRHHWVH